MSSKTFQKPLYLLILFFTFIVAYSYTFSPNIAMLGDNASYYILGKALSEGEGYVNLSSLTHSPNNHYPPGYPAIISLIMQLDNSIWVIKATNGLLFLLSLWILFEIVHRITHHLHFAFAFSFLCLINAHLLYYASVVLSEIPFLLFSSLSLLAFMKVDLEKFSCRDPYLIISIICFVIAWYIRSLGIALLGGYLLYFLVNRRWKAVAIYLICFLAASLPWMIRGQRLGGSSYVKQLRMVDPYKPELGQAGLFSFADRIFDNFFRYVTREIPSSILPILKPDYHSPLSAAEYLGGISILAILGYGLYALPKYRWLITGYVLGTLALLMVWPAVWIGVRFIVPITPFLMLGFFYGCYALLKKASMKISLKRNFQVIWLLAFALLYIKPVHTLHEQARKPNSPGWKSYFELASWLKQNSHKNVVVGTSKPELFYLYSNTYGVRYKFARDPEALIIDLKKNEVAYVVIDQIHKNTVRYLLPAVEQHPELFEEVYRVKNTNTYLLKFKSPVYL